MRYEDDVPAKVLSEQISEILCLNRSRVGYPVRNINNQL